MMEISEGILLVGSKSDNKFLLRSMVFTIVLVNCALQISHHFGWGLVGVWCVTPSHPTHQPTTLHSRDCARTRGRMHTPLRLVFCCCRWALVGFYLLRMLQPTMHIVQNTLHKR